MVAQSRLQLLAEFSPKFLDTFASALAGRVITQTQGPRVAGIVAIGDEVIQPVRSVQKAVEQMILIERIAQPEVAAVGTDEDAEERIGQAAPFVIIAAGLLGR